MVLLPQMQDLLDNLVWCSVRMGIGYRLFVNQALFAQLEVSFAPSIVSGSRHTEISTCSGGLTDFFNLLDDSQLAFDLSFVAIHGLALRVNQFTRGVPRARTFLHQLIETGK